MGGGDDLGGVAIVESNTHQRWQNRDNDQIGSGRNTTTTTMMMTKGADDTMRRTPPRGGKYTRRAKTRRRDWHLPRRYVVQPSRLTAATQHSFSWWRQ
jgi:hypothetical protein